MLPQGDLPVAPRTIVRALLRRDSAKVSNATASKMITQMMICGM
jgi:hypothetical protein